MEYAVIRKTKRLILITNALAEFGEDVARSIIYECPECQCQVYPSFPEIHKNFREKAPSAYFSARGNDKHVGECFRDILIVEDIKKEEIFKYISSSTTDHPQMFLETARQVRNVKNVFNSKTLKSKFSKDSFAKKNTRHRNSISSSCKLQRFVDSFENNIKKTHLMRIKIQNCAAKTYKEAFVPVENLQIHKNNFTKKQIFYGVFEELIPSKNGNGISIILKSSVPTMNKIRIWVPKGLMPRSLRKALWERISKCANGDEGVVYALGSFRRMENSNVFSLFLSSLNQFWISLLTEKNFQQP